MAENEESQSPEQQQGQSARSPQAGTTTSSASQRRSQATEGSQKAQKGGRRANPQGGSRKPRESDTEPMEPTEGVQGASQEGRPVEVEDSGYAPQRQFPPQASIDPSAGYEVAKPDGKILGPDDPLEFDGTETGNMITVNENVFREIRVRNARRPSYVTVFKAGTQIPKTTVQALGGDTD
jgi:hypothetical protein